MGVAVSNALLCRWSNGFTEVDDYPSSVAYGRIEGFLSVSQLTDITQALAVANATLATTAVEQLTVTAQIEPVAGGDVPYEGFDLGDSPLMPTEDGTSTARQRAITFTVSEDGEGNPIFAAEFAQAALIAEQRWTQWLTQMLSGTLAGTATSAAPPVAAAPPAPVVSDEILAFDQPGLDSTGSPILLATGESNATPVNRTGVLYKVVVFLDGPTPGYGAGPNVLTVYVNHASIGTVTVAAGKQGAIGYFAKPVRAALTLGATTPPDVVSVNFTTVDGVATGAHILASVH